jgi:hypothetical protein
MEASTEVKRRPKDPAINLNVRARRSSIWWDAEEEIAKINVVDPFGKHLDSYNSEKDLLDNCLQRHYSQAYLF